MLEILNKVNKVETSDPTYYRWNDRRRTISPVGESVTDTSFGNDTDINNIVERFARTGKLPEGPSVQPVFEDVTALQGDLTGLLKRTEDARKELARLEAEQKQAAAEQAAKDKADLEAYRAQQAALSTDQPGEAPSEPS